jgi:hypothetical protein
MLVGLFHCYQLFLVVFVVLDRAQLKIPLSCISFEEGVVQDYVFLEVGTRLDEGMSDVDAILNRRMLKKMEDFLNIIVFNSSYI